jgi:hypothetical protein
MSLSVDALPVKPEPMADFFTLLTYLQLSVIKWAKQRPGQSPFDVKSDEAIQI